MSKLYWFISASVLILVIIGIRAVFGKRMRSGVRYALWALILLRLLIPGTLFHSSFSVASLMEKAKDTPVYTVADTAADVRLPKMSYSAAYDIVAEEYAAKGVDISAMDVREFENVSYEIDAARTGNVTVNDILLYIWYAGMTVTAIVFAASNLRLYFKFRQRRRPIEADCNLPVYAVESLSSSCLFGRAVYVSAETAADGEQLRHVLSHEMSHYRHGDSVWALLRCAALAVHWFNPLVWWAAVLSRRDSEIFADAGAVAVLGESERENYGVTLIQLSAKHKSSVSLLSAATTMTNGKKALRERVRMIAKKPHMNIAVILAVVLIAAVAAGCAFTGAKEEKREFAPQEINISTAESSGTSNHLYSTVWDGTDVMAYYTAYCELRAAAEPVTDTEIKRELPVYQITFHDNELDENIFFTISPEDLCTFGNDTTYYQIPNSNIYFAMFEELFRTLQNRIAASASDLTAPEEAGPAQVILPPESGEDPYAALPPMERAQAYLDNVDTVYYELNAIVMYGQTLTPTMKYQPPVLEGAPMVIDFTEFIFDSFRALKLSECDEAEGTAYDRDAITSCQLAVGDARCRISYGSNQTADSTGSADTLSDRVLTFTFADGTTHSVDATDLGDVLMAMDMAGSARNYALTDTGGSMTVTKLSTGESNRSSACFSAMVQCIFDNEVRLAEPIDAPDAVFDLQFEFDSGETYWIDGENLLLRDANGSVYTFDGAWAEDAESFALLFRSIMSNGL